MIQKGGAAHTLLISKRAEAALGDYLSVRQDDRPELFINAAGRRLTDGD